MWGMHFVLAPAAKKSKGKRGDAKDAEGTRRKTKALRRLLAFSVGWVVLEDLLEWDIEDACDAEGGFERRRILVELDGDNGLAGDSDGVGEFLLGHRVCSAEIAKSVAETGH